MEGLGAYLTDPYYSDPNYGMNSPLFQEILGQAIVQQSIGQQQTASSTSQIIPDSLKIPFILLGAFLLYQVIKH